jgi:hypothetical protein
MEAAYRSVAAFNCRPFRAAAVDGGRVEFVAALVFGTGRGGADGAAGWVWPVRTKPTHRQVSGNRRLRMGEV